MTFNGDRTAYFRALDSARPGGRYEEWVSHFVACLRLAYERAAGGVGVLESLSEGLQGAPRAIVEEALARGPGPLRVGEPAKALGYKPITVSLALAELQRKGFVEHNGRRGPASSYHRRETPSS